MASKGSNRRQSPVPLSSPSYPDSSNGLEDLLAHAGHLLQLMDSDADDPSLRPYAEAIGVGLGWGKSGEGDIQGLISGLKSAAETAINDPKELEELGSETLARYQRDYLEHFPQPEGMPVDTATPSEFSRWLDSGECLPEALADSNQRLNDLYRTPAHWVWTPEAAPMAAITVPGMPPWPLALHQVVDHWKASARQGVLHPLFPLMQEWTNRPRPAAPELRRHGVVPRGALDIKAEQGRLFALPRTSYIVRDVLEPAYLPGLEPSGRAKPATTLALFDAMGLSKVVDRGRNGEAVDRRLMLETMMTAALPRRNSTSVTVPLRTIRDWLWPNGWHRGRDWPKLLEAFQTINQAWLPYEGMIDGRWQRRMWLPVTVVDIPATPDLDAPVVLHIRVRPGDTGNGALIDRQQLRKYGAESAPLWRGYLSAAHHWDQHGTFKSRPIQPTRPVVERGPGGVIIDQDGRPVTRGDKPETRWTHARAVWTGEVEENPAARRFGLLQVFTADDMVGFCFPGETPSGAKLRKYRVRAMEHHERMHEDNAVVLEEDQTPDGDRGWRILRPAELRMPQLQ